MTENIVTLLGIVLLIIVKFSGKKIRLKLYFKNIYSCHLGIIVVIMVVIMEVGIIVVVVIMVVVSSVTSTL